MDGVVRCRSWEGHLRPVYKGVDHLTRIDSACGNGGNDLAFNSESKCNRGKEPHEREIERVAETGARFARRKGCASGAIGDDRIDPLLERGLG